LPIAHRIIERHGGKLTLESTAERGTIARVDLPEAAAVVAQAA
jgi:signal transduction histidine kinase